VGSVTTRRRASPAAVGSVLRASRVLVGVAAASLANVEGTVSLAQYRTLVVLASRGPGNLAALAEHLGVNPSTATRSVDRLVAAKLVRRSVSREDRRNVILSVTPAGRRVVDQVTEHRQASLAGVLARMTEDQQRALTAAMDAFADAAGERDVRPDPALQLDLSPVRPNGQNQR